MVTAPAAQDARRGPFDKLRVTTALKVTRIIVALVFALGIIPAPVFAKSHVDEKIQAQKAKIHAVHQKLNVKRTQLEEAKTRVGTIAAELSDTNRNIAQVNGRLGELQARITSTTRKLAWNRIQLAAAQKTLQRHREALNRRLVDAYEHGDLGYVDV
ncbi:MAG TPA: hypothetical protein VGY57_03330, partial [Vicinamibacterales bacterium]|nr:hypothetical protein [Vicinamibacterales bacterium]